jgi:hypothetical protein
MIPTIRCLATLSLETIRKPMPSFGLVFRVRDGSSRSPIESHQEDTHVDPFNIAAGTKAQITALFHNFESMLSCCQACQVST